jgi:hypothetical protein
MANVGTNSIRPHGVLWREWTNAIRPYQNVIQQNKIITWLVWD